VRGVSPAENFPMQNAPFGLQFSRREPVGETPTGATGTVALPISTTLSQAQSDS